MLIKSFFHVSNYSFSKSLILFYNCSEKSLNDPNSGKSLNIAVDIPRSFLIFPTSCLAHIIAFKILLKLLLEGISAPFSWPRS